MTNITISYEGRNYTLIGDAILTNHQFRAVYEAKAVETNSTPDAEGWQTAYTVRWEISEDYNPEYQEEDSACDWDSPDTVEESGEYNHSDNRFC